MGLEILLRWGDSPRETGIQQSFFICVLLKLKFERRLKANFINNANIYKKSTRLLEKWSTIFVLLDFTCFYHGYFWKSQFYWHLTQWKAAGRTERNYQILHHLRAQIDIFSKINIELATGRHFKNYPTFWRHFFSKIPQNIIKKHENRPKNRQKHCFWGQKAPFLWKYWKIGGKLVNILMRFPYYWSPLQQKINFSIWKKISSFSLNSISLRKLDYFGDLLVDEEMRIMDLDQYLEIMNDNFLLLESNFLQ